MSWESLEDAFKELDDQEFGVIATALGGFRSALMKNGFTRREAIRLVETYSKFIYDMSIEEFISQKRDHERRMYGDEWHEIDPDEEGDTTVDPDEEE